KMRLFDYMDKKLIFLDLHAHSKEEALAEIVKRMKENNAIKNESDLLQEINNRETQGGTSLGNGVAIPHARLKSLDKIVVAMARLSAGIDFGIEDHEPVSLIFILITPTDRAGEYLKVLAKLSKFLKERELLKQLFATDTIQATWQLFESVDNQEI
ncbi:MAG: PTS sugar transporter subunit IIA, partial [Candidatus Aminicenantes bacterium]|nr:PTS sugar transporter subunit IIA [Candidatus Aminicenantes bacterium]